MCFACMYNYINKRVYLVDDGRRACESVCETVDKERHSVPS